MWIWLFVYTLSYLAYLYITSYHSIFNNHFKDLKGLWCRLWWTKRLARGRGIYFPLINRRQRSSTTNLSQGLWPIWHGELDSCGRTSTGTKFSSQNVDQSLISNFFLCLPREILENMHPHIMHHIMIGFYHTSLLIFLLFISVEMALEQTIKDIQAQNAQLREMFLNLSKG